MNERIWELFLAFKDRVDGPRAWLESSMDAMSAWVAWHVNDDVGGVFSGDVRTVDGCDAVQHTEQIVDTLDVVIDAPAIVCIAWLLVLASFIPPCRG